MAMPARKLNFDEILSSVPLLSVGEKETLEILLQENLYNEIRDRRTAFAEE
jgi:phospholipid N-methyltransferase